MTRRLSGSQGRSRYRLWSNGISD